MSDINSFVLQQATAAAAKLWALGSAPFPFKTSTARVIQSHIDMLVTETAIDFAIHVRRILDNSAVRTKFKLSEPFRHWAAHRLPKVDDLRDALNRIVHATEFEVGFEQLPENAVDIKGGAIGVVYLRTRTDQREEALIDVFALASCFFHQVLPELHRLDTPSTLEAVQ
ncbi:MAG TPA: hypothetical protein VFA04_00450 [Bryobacteraceae bacterium]|nr:hypothetical protein [Bryobacteraceae bacterium]